MTARRVLFIPELLDLIFNFLDKRTNVTNACVCKRWSDVALDVVWKEVDDLLRLFRLLKPILHQEDSFEYYVSCPRVSYLAANSFLLDSALRRSQKPTTGPGSKSMPLASGP